MTPADIQNKRFDKGMGGYKVEDVHQFLLQVADYVEELHAENDELDRKMEILAEKLEQYREDEESLRAALIGAQKLGQSVVKESQRKAETIVAQAVRKAEQLVGEAQQNIDKEALALKKMQTDVAGFRARIISLYENQLEMIKKLPDAEFQPDVKVASIQYTPPAIESVELEALEQEEDDTQEAPILSVVGSGQPAEENRESRRERKFGGIGEFFGEDKPIERQ